MKLPLVLLSMAGVISSPTTAQLSVTPLAEVSPVRYLPVGTVVPVRILADLTTRKKRAYVGQRFAIETAAPVMLNSLVIIPAGTQGEGEIAEVHNKGMWGKSGFVEARAVHLNFGGRLIRLTGSTNDKGVTGTAAVIGAVATSWPLGFIMTGTSATIPKGTAFIAILDEDLPFATSQAQVMAPIPAAPAISARLGEPRLGEEIGRNDFSHSGADGAGGDTQ
ncbi:hypothetical protein [Sphingobium sp.]|uniref:hypothetical protein n=1 Tax=Sphingobium sp. TaxID=1912891 RepID=UPI0035C7737F